MFVLSGVWIFRVRGVLRWFRIWGNNRKPNQKKLFAKHPCISGCNFLVPHTSHITRRFWSQSRIWRCPDIHTFKFCKGKSFYFRTSFKTLKSYWRGAAQNFGKRGTQNCRRDTLWFIGASKSLYPNEQIQEIATTLGREYTALQNGNRTLIKCIIMTLCSFGAGSGSAARMRIRVWD